MLKVGGSEDRYHTPVCDKNKQCEQFQSRHNIPNLNSLSAAHIHSCSESWGKNASVKLRSPQGVQTIWTLTWKYQRRLRRGQTSTSHAVSHNTPHCIATESCLLADEEDLVPLIEYYWHLGFNDPDIATHCLDHFERGKFGLRYSTIRWRL
jgi:hypothetical protein